jgi:hypothetical protein
MKPSPSFLTRSPHLLFNQPRKLSFSVRSLVSREPQLWLLYQPYLWWAKLKQKAAGEDPQERLITAETELVIDGFQGSANSFATIAFQHSQNRTVKLAHHLHAPSQILQAIDQNIPVLLTIREPTGTILSLTSRWSYVSVTQGLRSYIEFYRKIEPYASNCVISTFEQTTQQLDQVLRSVNDKFGTNFAPIDLTIATRECKPKISDSPEIKSRRQRIKQEKQKEFTIPRNTRLLQQATQLYQKYERLNQR